MELSETHAVFTSMKSYLGTDHEFIVGDHRYTATDITAEFLKYIKKSIAESYKIDISEATFSFPVDFTPEARRELRVAAERAGITIQSFISESTAAYLANRRECSAFSNVMVLDWGGGTLDISVLHLHLTEVHEISVSGCHIGGDDIDRALAERIHAQIAAKSGIADGAGFEDMTAEQQDLLIMRCEEAKIAVSASDLDEDDDYSITIQNYGDYGTKTIYLPSEYLNDIAEAIIRKYVLPTIEEALRKAELSRISIDAVIVVGGSSCLRPYENVIMNLFQDSKIIFPQKRQWSAAEGAALMQLIGGNFRLNDTLGVLLSDGNVYPVFEGGKNAVGDRRNPITFSLTEDSLDAHFIFTDGSGNNTLAALTVPTKGFFTEKLELYAELRKDQIAQIRVLKKSMGREATRQCEINKLTFYYDVKSLDGAAEQRSA